MKKKEFIQRTAVEVTLTRLRERDHSVMIPVTVGDSVKYACELAKQLELEGWGFDPEPAEKMNILRPPDNEPKVGQVGYFWDDYDEPCAGFGILSQIDEKSIKAKYSCLGVGWSKYFSTEPPAFILERAAKS